MAFENFNFPAFKSREFKSSIQTRPKLSRIEVNRTQDGPSKSNHDEHLFHTAKVELGTVPETQQQHLHRYQVKQSVDSCVPHASMGYFPARIMRMEKQKPFKKHEAQTEYNQRTYVEAKRPRKTKKKRTIKRRRDASANKPGIHPEPQQTEIPRGRLVRSMLKDIETTPTFRDNQRDMWPSGTVFITGREEDDEILVNPITIRRSRQKNSFPTRPKSAHTSATTSRIRKGKMYEQMSNGIRASVVRKSGPRQQESEEKSHRLSNL